MGDKRAPEFVNEGEFVAENETVKVLGFGAENELGKRIKQASIDRLSLLPDYLLIHILSFLDKNLNQAVATCVLSKRWQFLWSELPSLKFWDRSLELVSLLEFMASVHRTLLLRTGMCLDHFSADFIYIEHCALDVNAWVHFAVKRNVKTLELKLQSPGQYYKLPQMLYSSSSLECLFIQRYIVAPYRRIEWQSLTEIDFEDVKLDERIIQEILSGCPVLQTWEMRDCWGFKRLNLNSKSLYEFFIFEYGDIKEEDNLLEISAPYLRSLQFKLHLEGRKLKLTNIPSIVSADIDFHGYDESEDSMNDTRELFEMIQHVKYLKVGFPCIEILSELVVHGWKFPQSERISLNLDCLGDEYNLPGVIGLFESSPKLETLVINFCIPNEYDDKTWIPAARDNLDCSDLSHLKTVHLNNSSGEQGVACEIILTMARILLKRATSLEKMEIIAKGNIAKMSETVHSYPRSSEKAVFIFQR